MKNPAFYPKTVELIVDWQQVESIADPDLRLFFMEAKNCLADFFPFHERKFCSGRFLYGNRRFVFQEDSSLFAEAFVSRYRIHIPL